MTGLRPGESSSLLRARFGVPPVAVGQHAYKLCGVGKQKKSGAPREQLRPHNVMAIIQDLLTSGITEVMKVPEIDAFNHTVGLGESFKLAWHAPSRATSRKDLVHGWGEAGDNVVVVDRSWCGADDRSLYGDIAKGNPDAVVAMVRKTKVTTDSDGCSFVPLLR